MNRIAAYINKDTMEREDVAFLMADDSEDIKIYRYTQLSDNDGFRKQTPERTLRYIKVVKGRVDKRDRSSNPQYPTDGQVTAVLYIATLYYKDLQVDDVLVTNTLSYVVTAINKIGMSFTEAEVEVQS